MSHSNRIRNAEAAKLYDSKIVSLDTAVGHVKSGDRVYIGTCTSIPFVFNDRLAERAEELENVQLFLSQYTKPSDLFTEKAKGHFTSSSYFMGPMERLGVKNGITTFTSFHLSQVSRWCKNIAKPDISVFEVSLPDENGYMSYGATGVALDSFLQEVSPFIILQVNKNAPYVYGESNLIHVSQADMIFEADDELPELANLPADEDSTEISKIILDQIPDGATIQLGLGGLSGAIGFGLATKNDLGIHSELMTDSLMHLVKNGNVTNQKKTYMKGKSVVSFAFGSKELYEFLDYNEDMYFAPFDVVNKPETIALNDNMVSVNTAMQLDVFGQVAADSIGYHQQSATGGQVDFVRGAQESKGGKSFIAITSSFVDKKGERQSRISTALPPGTCVTTPRSDVQFVVTEYGCVNLKNLDMKDRVRAMISLAHPQFREQLTDEAKQYGIL